MASPGKLPRNPTFAIARFKYGIGPAEDAKSHTELEESVCAGLVEKSMRELVEGGQGITLSTVMEQMAFVHGFDALANSELIKRSINTLREHSNMTSAKFFRIFITPTPTAQIHAITSLKASSTSTNLCYCLLPILYGRHIRISSQG